MNTKLIFLKFQSNFIKFWFDEYDLFLKIQIAWYDYILAMIALPLVSLACLYFQPWTAESDVIESSQGLKVVREIRAEEKDCEIPQPSNLWDRIFKWLNCRGVLFFFWFRHCAGNSIAKCKVKPQIENINLLNLYYHV